MEAEWQERDKYCKFKAGNILKCLKTGEEPKRGNPFVKEEEQTDAQLEDNGYEESKIPPQLSSSG